ncbi:NAAT family transporter [Niveispirillum sp. SYP-B3756]|uniref:MarC family protein n=1 Tax=Niveispirillum sp. SYP-B3756 TaxID=2662178 RepID=UPI001290C1C6|nr:MarC family protein [Niveispirillum sp. SYP-B3756]MQP65706.1 NAAT family transporter [Niveispirillum sp. SYP-B3756]
MEAWSEYSRFLIALFAILTPFAAIPIFLGMTEGRTREQRNAIAQSAVLTVATVLISSVFLGDAVLTVLGTSLASFRVGGGIVLLLIALSLLNASVSAMKHTEQEADEAGQRTAIGVVPLGLPLLAGPGSISAVIIEAQRGQGWEHFAILVGCILAVCAGLLATLRLAVPIGNKLGQTGLNIMNRLTGLLLAAVAVEIIAAGLRALFPGWMT